MKADEVIKALKCCCSSPKADRCKNECIFYRNDWDMSKCIGSMGKVTADLLEQQAEIIVQWQNTAKVAVHNEVKARQEIEQIAKDRDQWKVVAEASRDVIQPKLRAEIEQLKASQPVRCKDCIYCKHDEQSYFCGKGLCGYNLKSSDYCSYGERRFEE